MIVCEQGHNRDGSAHHHSLATYLQYVLMNPIP